MPIHVGLGVGLTMGGGIGSATLPMSFSPAPVAFYGLERYAGSTSGPMGYRRSSDNTTAGIDVAADLKIDDAAVITFAGIAAPARGTNTSWRNQVGNGATIGSATAALGQAAEPAYRTDIKANGFPVSLFQTNSQLAVPTTYAVNKNNHAVMMVLAPESATMLIKWVTVGQSNDLYLGPTGSRSAGNMGLTVVEGGSTFLVSSLIPATGQMDVVGYSSGSDGVRIYCNGQSELVTSTPRASAALTGAFIGDLVNYSNDNACVFWNTSLTAAQMAAAGFALSAAAPAPATPNTLAVIVGDSRTAGQGSIDNFGMGQQLRTTVANPTRYKWYNCGEAGQTISAQKDNMSALLSKLVADNSSLTRKILIINNDGINDDRGSTLATTTLANHRAMAATAQGLGFYVISMGCAAAGDALGLANVAITNARNASLQADHTAFNGWYDISAQSYASDPNDTTYYTSDKLHHTNAFYALNAAGVKPLVDAAP